MPLFGVLLLYFYLYSVPNSFGQCPQASFMLSKDTVCVGEELSITNNSVNVDSYEWDFCLSGIYQNDLSYELELDANDYFPPESVSLVKDLNGTFHVFLMNINGNSLYRVTYNKNMDSIISSSDLGNPGGYFDDNSSDINFIYENSTWYGMMMSGNSKTLLRMKFSSGLDSVPQVDTVNTYRLLTRGRFQDFIKVNDSIYGVFRGKNYDNIVILSFGNSIENQPDTITISDPILTSSLFSFSFVKQCSTWIGFTCNADKSIYRLNFGNSLSNSPVIEDLGNFGILNKINHVKVINSNGIWILLIVTQDQGIFRCNFNKNLLGIPSGIDKLVDISSANLRNATYSVTDSSWVILINSKIDGIYKAVSNNQCYSNIHYSYINEPSKLFYSTPGEYNITLKVSNSGIIDTYNDTIFVKGKINPKFNYDQTCNGDSSVFENKSTTKYDQITKTIWRFDMGDSLSGDTVQYLFPDSGKYNVKLIVESSCGKDSVTKEIRIIDKPVANFDNTKTCFDSSYFFTDNTVDIPGLHNFRHWQFGDGDTSLLQNPNHIYSDTGKFQVIFITGVEGCTDTLIDTITFYSKPRAQFDFKNICIGDSTLFSDSSALYLDSLIPVNQWNWNFGDAGSDTVQFPKYLYADSGKYQVQLIVTTDKNCSDTITKAINIQKPISKFIVNERICDNFPITFSDSSIINADSITSWVWNFDVGDSAFVQFPTYAFKDSGSFNVYLKVTSSQDCVHDTIIPLYVNLGPSVDFLFDTVCSGLPMTFLDKSTIVPSDTISGWNWDFGDSINIDTSQNPTNTYVNDGKFEVSLIVSTQKGCKSLKLDTVISKPLPNISFNYSTPCFDNKVKFFDYSSINNVIYDSLLKWKWIYGDGVSDSTQNPTHIFNLSKNYNVSLIVTTNNFCVDTLQQTVFVNPLPNIAYTYTEVCESETTSFLVTDTTYSLFWNLGDTTNPQESKTTIANPSYKYPAAGEYNVNLVVVSAVGCTTDINKAIDVNFVPTTKFGYNNFCQKFLGTFYDSSSVNKSTITIWNWDFGGGVGIDSSQNPVHSFADTGKYSISLLVYSEKGCSASVSNEMQVFPLPDPEFDFNPEYGIPPLEVDFAIQTKDSATYYWVFGDQDTSTQINPSHTYTDTGEYIIQLIATNKYGCIDTLQDLIRVKEPVLDLIVNELQLNEVAGYFEAFVTFTNFGNRNIESVQFDLEYVGKSTIREEWTGFLLPGDSDCYPFYSKSKKENTDDVNLVCVDAVLLNNNESDDNSNDNKQCITLEKEFDLLYPIYNHESKTITLQLISDKEQKMNVYLYDLLGKILLQTEVTCNKGYNQIQIDVAQQQAGMYIYSIMNSENKASGKVTILN